MESENTWELLKTMDAVKWADEYIKLYGGDRSILIVWFANAIMVGYDQGRRAGEELIIDKEPNHGGP